MLKSRNRFGRAARQLANAYKFRVPFLRTRWFHIPDDVVVSGKRVHLSYPANEPGVRADFLVCIIRDDYGLHDLRSLRRIVDIGANVGWFSLAARNFHRGAEIHAYEPNPRIFPNLQQNLGKLDIRTFNEAVGRLDGRVSMVDSCDSNLASTVSSPQGAITLTSFAKVAERIGGQIDLLKLDCEGAEWDLLEDPETWNRVRELRMEYHLSQGKNFNDLTSRLEAVGFRITHHSPDIGFGTIWATSRFPAQTN